MSIDAPSLTDFQRNVREHLLRERHSDGHWVGELSSSALSTATAIVALSLYNECSENGRVPEKGSTSALVSRGVSWLVRHQNEDGGWGDTTDSPSNISTTVLCWAALTACRMDDDESIAAITRGAAWLFDRVGDLTPVRLASAICKVYGVDKTFSAPILTMCAICGCFKDPQDAWRRVPALPFELALVPHRWYHRLGLPVVSYALPALIAIGQARHHHRPTRNPIARVIRNLARRRTLDALIRMQPASGGYLEATPITSFVAMSLIAIGRADHPTAQSGVRFLADSVRDDGSWPIDTNLATWITTLSINALFAGSDDALEVSVNDRHTLINWLLNQQHRARHPYTNAAPGGWAWTDLSGGVPDADDTPGALLTLAHLVESAHDAELVDRTAAAATDAVRWLLNLQNRDGGIPTFCRGWGKLPFDRSSPDLTAHTLRAWHTWQSRMPGPLQRRMGRAIEKAIQFLVDSQGDGGAWVPLWFGHQSQSAMENPVYGTSRVLLAGNCRSRYAARQDRWMYAQRRGCAWLLAAQNENGGWGGDARIASSVEETAVAVEAVAVWMNTNTAGQVATDAGAPDDPNEAANAVARGIAWLQDATLNGTAFAASPIGLYFAKLWYSERLYPLIFTTAALAHSSQLAPACVSPAPTARQHAR